MSKIQQLCEAVGGDYKELMQRLVSEDFVARFAVKFLSDDTYNQLKHALAAKDAESAFRAAHTLKGVAQSLGFGNLGRSASVLTEVLRQKKLDGTTQLFADVTADYDNVIASIKSILLQ